MKAKRASFSDRIWRLFKKQDFAQARDLLLDELENSEKRDDHWLLCRISTTYYEERNYRPALAYIQKALKLAPDCPLALWGLAGVLDMLEREREAIAIWERLLRRGEENIAFGACGEGLKWAKALMLDCLYRLALAHRDLKNYRQARWYMTKHINGRYPGNGSIYGLKEARARLAQINELSRKGMR